VNYKIFNENNLNFNDEVDKADFYDLIYCDMIYENKDIADWLYPYWNCLKYNGIFIVQTDWHTDYLVRDEFEQFMSGPVFVNHVVWKNEWGNHPKNKMHQCFDSIIIYAKGKNYKFYSEKIQVPKVTKTKGLNPSGRETKQATAWIDDICLTTTAKERIKKEDGHLIKWQKPLCLFDRIVAPFVDENDWICDPFMGSGSLGEWAILNNCNYVGKELGKEVFELAEKRLENAYRSGNL
jgi:DNA modification methylase